MKKLVLIAGMAVGFMACNSGDDNNQPSTTAYDSANHSANTINNDQGKGQNHMKALHEAMNTMMQQMQNTKHTGDADYDFALMMKHHHQ